MPRRSACSSSCRPSTSGWSCRATTSRRRSRSSWCGRRRRAASSLPMRWGLHPGLGEGSEGRCRSSSMARAEGIAEKPAFRDAFRRRRCLVPASGFYEWQARGKGPKQPYAVRPAEARAHRLRRPVGDLARRRRQRDRHGGDRDDRRQRAPRRDPRPHAGRHRAGGFRRRGSRGKRIRTSAKRC